MTFKDLDNSYTLQEVADKIHITRRTLYGYVKAGELKAEKFGKEYHVTKKALDEFMKQGGPSRGYYKKVYVRKSQRKETAAE